MTTYINQNGDGGFFDPQDGGSSDFTPPENKLAGKPIRKFLYAMQVKGAKICDDLQITNSGEIYLKDGTGMSSLVKDVEFLTEEEPIAVQQTIDGVVTLLEGEISDDASEASRTIDLGEGEGPERVSDLTARFGGSHVWVYQTIHFMKITRPNGAVEKKPVVGMDQMLNGMDSDDLVESLPELVAKVQELKEATLGIIDENEENPTAREHDVDHLESAFDKFVVDFRDSLVDMEKALRDQANIRDKQIIDDSTDRLDQIVIAMNGTMDRDYGIASIGFDQFVGLNNQGVVEVVKTLSGSAVSDPGRYDISNWIVETTVLDTSLAVDQIHNSSVWHTAKIEDDKIKVEVRLVDCADLTAQRKVQVAVAYCGSLGSVDVAIDPTDRTARLYNAEGGGGDLAPVLPEPMPDSDSNHNPDGSDGPTPAKINKGTYVAPTP